MYRLNTYILHMLLEGPYDTASIEESSYENRLILYSVNNFTKFVHSHNLDWVLSQISPMISFPSDFK
jgi:hypothetical protein